MWYHYDMSKVEKLLLSMKNNRKDDWVIDDLKAVATRYNIDYRQPGTSHVTFRTKQGVKLTVPARKPIKPIYIKMFIELIEQEEK